MMERDLEFARKTAEEAGDLLLRYFRRPCQVERKESDEPVTEADRGANALIVSALRARFPNDAVLSEEEADDGSRHGVRRVWMVDPMDGTKDFIRGDEGFSVMIGLVEEGQAVLGVVFQPTEPRLYFAAKGLGAHVEVSGRLLRLVVSGVAKLADARLVSSKSNRGAELAQVKQALGVTQDRPHGSVGLKVALVAAGECDLYVNPSDRSKLWDVAAPEAILTEAGGRLTDVFGKTVDYRRQDLTNRHGIVASNGVLHDAVVAKLAPVFRQ